MKKFFFLYGFLFFAQMMFAQTSVRVGGVVIDENDNLPVIGANVTVRGTTAGVITDINGHFEIAVPAGRVLVVSYIGYQTFEETITASNTSMRIVLKTDAYMLDEFVAVGYGTMRKSDLTGAVASVKGDALKKTPAANLTQALQGRAAGVTVNANSGQPGAAASVYIRGIGTLNNSQPIYVVDGIITSDISFVNANDIESTEILKDASAAAIYGSRGANGVVIITTKTGKEKEGKISFDSYVGIQNRWKKHELMKGREFARTLVNLNEVKSEIDFFNNWGFNQWLKTYRLGSSPYYPVVYNAQSAPDGFDYSKQETDWQDEVFVANAPIQSYNISFSGGDEKKTFALSAGYFDQQGTIIGSYYKRLTLRSNASYQIRNWIKIGEAMTYVNSTHRNTPNNNGSAGASVLTGALAMAPWDPTHYPEGTLNLLGEDIGGRPAAASNFKNVTNPFSMIAMSHPRDYTDRIVGNVHLELTPIKGLSIRSAVSVDFSLDRNRSFGEKYEYSTYDKRDKNFLASSLSRYYMLTTENIATYSKSIDKHSFSIMAGQTTEEWNFYRVGNSGSTILNPVESNWYLSQTTADNTGVAGDEVNRTRMLSFLGRLLYNYDDRYLLTVNFRADGSSKFPRHLWGYFPSTALGWRISREGFMEDVAGINDLKLRLGWGQLGNQSSVGSADFIQDVNTSMYFSTYILGKSTAGTKIDGSVDDSQTPAQGASVITWVNKDGRWEVTEQWNIALDLLAFRSRLSATVDLFRRETKEMLLFVTTPAYVGNLFSPKANVGTVRNDGIEITADYQDRIGKLSYTVGGNVSFIKNELVALNGGYPLYGDRVVSDQGLPLFTYYGYEYLGIYQSDEEAIEHLYATPPEMFKHGDAKYRDVNEDGKINDSDRVDLGNPFPWLSYGINLSANYLGIDLSVFFQGIYGNKLYNAQRHQLEGPGNATVMSVAMRDCWTPANPDGSIPNPRNAVNFYTSSRFVESGAYLRLKNVQLGYTLPQKLTKKISIDRCRFYVSGSNLLTITKYKGYDPEVGSLTITKYKGYDPEVGSNVDYGNYPQARTFLFGVNVDF
jgi:TonB-linked SusC/RagA family outer membrane protein